MRIRSRRWQRRPSERRKSRLNSNKKLRKSLKRKSVYLLKLRPRLKKLLRRRERNLRSLHKLRLT